MKCKLLLIALILFLIPLASALSFNSIEKDNWLVTKKSGLESNYVVSMLSDSKTESVFNLKIDESLKLSDKESLRDNIIEKESFISRSIDELNVTVPKSTSFFRIGQDTLLMERDDYWNLSNHFRSYYISKTGFQITNELNINWANLQWEIVLDGILYNSRENVWNWTFINNSDFLNLNGSSIIANESLEWKVSFYLDELEDFISISLSTNDTSRDYSQTFIHSDIDVSNNSVSDFITINGIEYNLSVNRDINISSSSSFVIKDKQSFSFIRMAYDLITDAIINIQQNKVTLYSLLKSISFKWVDALDSQSLFATTFFIDNSTTTSTSFETINVHVFNLTRNATMFVTTSFQGTKLTGAASKTDYFWRILFDDIEIINLTQALEVDETAPLTLQVTLGNIDIGTHNVTVQHRVSSDTLLTSGLSLAVTTSQFENGSSLPGQSNLTNFTSTTQDFLLKDSIDFFKVRNDTDIFVSIFGTLSTFSSNVDKEIKMTINGANAGTFSQRLDDASDTKTIAYSFVFDNLSNGTNTLDIFSKNLQPSKTTDFDGDIDIIETGIDDIVVNLDFDLVENFTTSSTSPVVIGNLNLNVSNESSVIIQSFATVTKTGALKHNITMFTSIEGVGASFNHTVELEGGADRAVLSFIATPPISIIPEVLNISIEAFVESGTTATLMNISFFVFEIRSLEAFNLAAPVPPVVDNETPVVTLLNPTDNQISNETNHTFTCSATDNILLDNVTFYWNLSGSFVGNGSLLGINSASVVANFTRQIPFNNTLIWNCEAFDNSSNSAFAPLNFTLIINQTFGLVVPPVNVTPPNITLITDSFDITTCPIGSVAQVLLFIFFTVIAFGIILIGWAFKNGLIGTFGGLTLLVISMFFYSCLAVFAMMLSGFSLLIMSFFVFRGVKAFR